MFLCVLASCPWCGGIVSKFDTQGLAEICLFLVCLFLRGNTSVSNGEAKVYVMVLQENFSVWSEVLEGVFFK